MNAYTHKILAGLISLGITACGNSSGVLPEPNAGTVARCDQPLSAAVRDESLVIDVPQDFDETSNPAPRTRVNFSVLLPPRCPGESFPLILHGPGFGDPRKKVLADNGDLPTDLPFHASLDALPGVLPYHGYVVISFDERGHGDGKPSNGGGYARLMDPNAETQDAIAILDWAFEHASELQIQTEPNSGIARDLKVGTLGASYGGGFQMALVALDARVDAIVPTNTWHSLLYSTLPGDAVKLAWAGILSLAVTTQTVTVTPLVQTLMNQVGLANPLASTVRTRRDLINAMSGPTAKPRAVEEQELEAFFTRHGMDYFEAQQVSGQPWGFGETQARLRPVPALYIQGNRDVLFNLTEAFWNWRYFAAAGADTRLLTNEGGHMNPALGQQVGDGHCGQTESLAAVLGWFDHHLKRLDTPAFEALPKVCISVADSIGAAQTPAAGVELQAVPVGLLTGQGAVAAQSASLHVELPLGTVTPVFVPVITIQGDDKVLAGIPRMRRISVAAAQGSIQIAIAFVGVGIRRDGNVILVDEQVTAFVEGDHDSNRGVAHAGELLLPGVDEMLHNGDEVGLLFYPQHAHYAALVSAQQLPGAPGLITLLPFPSGGPQIPIDPLASALNPLLGLLVLPNPYTITATDVQLPILIPGQYPGSRLSQ